LERENLLPTNVEIPNITRFEFSDSKGKGFEIPLDMGGFGISRYIFDKYLWDIAKQEGVHCLENTDVIKLEFNDPCFDLSLSDNCTLKAKYVLGAFGKKSRIDHVLSRSFLNADAPYIGVKYHIKADFPTNKVALHNFDGGYCGVSAIEEGKINLCYLALRNDLKDHGNIKAMEKALLYQNPYLNKLFIESEFLFDQPEVINAFTFAPKEPVIDHVLMIGDAAGLITPLCGNGMSIAIRSGKMAADSLLSFSDRASIESDYYKKWSKEFSFRLKAGRAIQSLFGSNRTSMFAAKMPFLGKILMPLTHGKAF
jgi:flavin-dependent dehydrogenase